jgi:hypothetical protein
VGKIAMHHGDILNSIRAAMIFPANEEKARIYVGWIMAARLRRLGHTPKYPHAAIHPIGLETVLAVGRDAVAFPHIKADCDKNLFAGLAVGEILKSLHALICSDPQTASIEAAIQVVEDRGFENGFKTGRSTFWKHLSAFQAVLHLCGAWSIRERKWKLSGEYTAALDARAFLTEAEILKRDLVSWNSKRSQPIKLLQGTFLDPYEGYIPYESEPQRAGRIPPLVLPTTAMPNRRPPGRPRKPRLG